ncbi:MAG: L,D-transpeptidase family protein [Rhodospirillales bacterium]|nr:L,D-transpeptidase family protein [Rhodospirillales bacterium]
MWAKFITEPDSRLVRPWFSKVAAGAIVLALLSLPCPAEAGDVREKPTVIDKITSFVNPGSVFQAALAAGTVDDSTFYDADAMRAFYQQRDNELIWTEKEANAAQINAMLTVFEDSWRHGLNPARYHVPSLRSLLSGPQNKETQARLELLLSDAVVRYGHDISGMRVIPEHVGEKGKYWRAPVPALTVLSRVAQAHAPAQELLALGPSGSLYKKLQEELVRLSREDDGYDHVLPLDFGVPFFKPGKRHPAVAGLRVRLGVEYDPAYGPEDFYDDELGAAVMRFQREHGLEPDAVIGPQTLTLLNRTRQAQMEQIIANLERLRWLDPDRPDRYMLVNIPSQTLWAISGGRVALEMPVVVGQPSRPTASFKTEVKGIRFNPTWTVPLSIKMKDFLPKILEDPSYLDHKGVELYMGYGKDAETIDPYDVAWENVGRKEMNQIRMVQIPGDHNALGRIRVLMPNEFDIYMHDTNHPELFDSNQRIYSSGCVRLSHPRDVARFVLAENRNWSEEKMDAVIQEGKMTDILSANPIPVYIVYQTVWLGEGGRIIYGPDVYGLDRRLVSELRSMDGFALPLTAPSTMTVDAAQRELASVGTF